jgi:hypothetical protein
MKSLALDQAQQSGLPSVVNAASAAAQIFPNLIAPAQAAVIPVGASGILEQREFGVRACGYATTAGAFTAGIILYGAVALPATPLVAGSWTVLATSTVRAIGTTTAPFKLAADFVCDSVSKLLNGTFRCLINSLNDAEAVTTVLPAVNPGGAVEPCMYFALGIIFSNANAANKGVLTNFYLIG